MHQAEYLDTMKGTQKVSYVCNSSEVQIAVIPFNNYKNVPEVMNSNHLFHITRGKKFSVKIKYK